VLREETPYVDFIIDLLEAHTADYFENGDPRPEVFPNSTEGKALNKIIESEVLGKTDANSTGGLFRNAFQWWNSKGVRQPDKSLARKILLGVIDRNFSDKPIERFYGSKKQIIVGRRFWNYLDRIQNNRDGFLDGARYSIARPFHHLHVATLKDDEWIDISQGSKQFSLQKKSRKEDAIPFRVGLFTFSKEVKTCFIGTKALDENGKNFGFLSDHVAHDNKSQEGYLQELRDCVSWANKTGLNILIMPELSVCPNGLNVLHDEIEKNPGELYLVIPGSFHAPSKEHEGCYANVAPIWLVKKGKIEVLAAYEKHEPFSMDVKKVPIGNACLSDPLSKARENHCLFIKEDISSGSRLYVISTRFGIITVFICKDFLFHDNKRLNDVIGFTDHLLVVSMNLGGGPFDYASWERSYFGTAIYYVNTLQACDIKGPKAPEAAFWRFPCKVNRDNANDEIENTFYLTPYGDRKQIQENHVNVEEIPMPRQMFV
jgi:hypothetical protein